MYVSLVQSPKQYKTQDYLSNFSYRQYCSKYERFHYSVLIEQTDFSSVYAPLYKINLNFKTLKIVNYLFIRTILRFAFLSVKTRCSQLCFGVYSWFLE